MNSLKNKGMLKKIALLSTVCLALLSLSITFYVNAMERKFNMSYAYFGSSATYATYVKYLDQASDSLNEISPNYFELNVDGSLKLTSKLDTDFIAYVHNKGIKVVPFISNGWNDDLGISALNNREKLSQQIADAVAKYDLDGVNVDIEALSQDYRDEYTDFVKLLSEKLPSDKTVAVAVAANPHNWSAGWQASYDYTALEKYSDYLMIMAYDDHYAGSSVGPVAGADFVEGSIKYALDKKVPAEKIVLGIPFYGRYWISGKSYGGYGISNYRVEDLIRKYGGKVTYDYGEQTPKAVITIKSTDPAYYLSGKKLEPGTYTIWYENEQSIKYKLTLVKKYNLKGTGSWSLGQETADTWKYYNLWLNGVYFNDAQDSWAREAILSMTLKGWFKGVSPTQFMPENSLTRAEAAAILVRAMGLEDTGDENGFPDIIGHWAEREIIIAKQHSIVIGDDNGYFNPDAPVSREEMAVMLERILTSMQDIGSKQVSYWDVNQDNSPWSYDAIMKMSSNGIFNGYPDGGFHPEDNISRAQMAQLMSNAESYFDQN